MAEPPSTETGGQQYWTDEHHRGHRLDGPATIATGNGERRMITWSCVGRPTKFILFNASSFYFAEKENKRSKTFTIKRKGVIGA